MSNLSIKITEANHVFAAWIVSGFEFMIYDVSTQTNCGGGGGGGGVKSVISDNCIFSILDCVV